MVFAVLPYSTPIEDEEGEQNMEGGESLHRVGTSISQAESTIFSRRHTDDPAGSPYSEEPESVLLTRTTSPLPMTPNVHRSPFTSSPTLDQDTANPSRSRVFSLDSGSGAKLSLPPNTRKNTRKSTTGLPLPPKLTLDDASREKLKKSTLTRGLSISLSPGIAHAMSMESDPEVLVQIWAVYAKEAFQSDRRMIASWNRSLDVRLLFSGIFSAILTPFIVESYKLLDGSKPSPAFFGTNGWKVRVNAMWFGSLIVSLIAALLSIHCKQWLDGYLIETNVNSANYASALERTCRLRQYRFEGLQNFYINEVIGLLPILLYISLMFFAIGLIDLLWHLNKGIAIYVSVLCGLVVIFHVVTTMLPFFTTRTPYRTPLSDFLGNLWRGMLQGRVCVKGIMEEEERKDVDRMAAFLDEKCFKWLMNNTESEEHFMIALRAENERRRQAARRMNGQMGFFGGTASPDMV